MFVFVGSSNPVKIKAAKLAVMGLWPDAHVSGFEVQSGVSHQPRSDQETRTGAEERAKQALKQGLSSYQAAQTHDGKSKDDLNLGFSAIGIGMEGGVFDYDGELWATVWASVADPTGRLVSANGSRFQVPELIAKPIRQGGEMGPVVAEISGIDEIKKKQGMIGLVTNEYVTRTEEYSSIAKMAFGLWYGQVKPWQT